MRIDWDIVALTAEDVYGAQYDRDEEFFICPECGEPIYKDDYESLDYDPKAHVAHCPVCECDLEV